MIRSRLRVLDRRGPLGDVPDELWARVLRQEISEAEYLARRTAEVGRALTNDLSSLGPPDARRRFPYLADLDVIVDGSVTGVLEPDPRAYLVAAEQLGRRPEDVVFLDDLPANVAGARTVGMTGVHVDVTAPGVAFAEARVALGPGDVGD